jgi:spore coat protein U-like protein
MNRVSIRLFLLLFLATCWQLAPTSAHADTANVTCAATVTPLNFGTVAPATTATTIATGSIKFTCTNVSLLAAQNVTLCVGLGYGAGTGPSRQMDTTPIASHLVYQAYKNSGATQVWGNVPSTSNPTPFGPLQFTIGFSLLGIPVNYDSPSYPVYGSLSTPQIGIASGSYLQVLNGSLTYQANNAPLLGSNYPSSCDGGGLGGFTITAQAIVTNQCTVSASSTLTLGSAGGAAAGTTNNTGSTTFAVTCTAGAPYTIGLSPNSTSSMTGADMMSGTLPGNTGLVVPYQLNQNSATGPIWGNTASSPTIAGNGVAGSGSGVATTYTVYATAPSSDYRPDVYKDIVTISINY